VATDDPARAFKDSDYALLVGARPRGPGMERKDLLEANAKIFSVQGRAINEHASRGIRVLVVGNPANTNALITQANAPDIDPAQITAMTRLDHNRAIAQLAAKTGYHVSEIRRMIIWGNHSATQYPDLDHATVAGRPARELVDQDWIERDFIPTVQQRGAAIIKARGAASAASAASAAIDHVRDSVRGTPVGGDREVAGHRGRLRRGWRHAGRRRGEHGGAGRGQLRLRGRDRLLVPGALPRRALRDRPRSRDQRVQPRAHARHRG